MVLQEYEQQPEHDDERWGLKNNIDLIGWTFKDRDTRFFIRADFDFEEAFTKKKFQVGFLSIYIFMEQLCRI